MESENMLENFEYLEINADEMIDNEEEESKSKKGSV